MMYLFFVFFFYLGPCIPARHFCIDMGYIDIGYCTYDIYDLWLCIYGYGCVYGHVFTGLYFWICVYGYVYGCVYGHVFTGLYFWICVYGYVFMAMCLWLCVWVSGLDPPRGPVHQISGLTSPWSPFPTSLGLTLPRGPFQQFLGLTPPRAHFNNF